MADAYRAKVDVSIPRVLATHGEGKDVRHETEGINYPAGAYVLAENMTPRDRDRAANGELDDVLHPVSLEEATQFIGHGEPEFAIFDAEHEAEAHALERYGHTVISKDQSLEMMSAGASYAHDYQQAVREAGADRRFPQEMMAQPRERIPAEVLQGTETRSGLPHDRGPGNQGVGPETGEGGSESHEESSSELAPRPRPGEAQAQPVLTEAQPQVQHEETKTQTSTGEGQ